MFQIVDKIFLKKFSTASKFDHSEFSKLKTNFERFKYVWDYDNSILNHDYTEFINTKLIEIKSAEAKDLEKAVKYREEGNELYKKKSFNDAIIKYNLSLKYSPVSSENIALTYSNRSAIFQVLKKYDLCLLDIEQAFENNYPSNNRNKLVDRKIDCLLKLNKKNEAIVYLKQVIANDKSIYSEEILNDFKDKIKNLENEDLIIEQLNITNEINLSQESSGLLNDHKFLTCDNNEQAGNYLKSLKTIEIGEELLVEKPFASVLLKEYIPTNCYNCMKRLISSKMNIKFCNYCVNVTYCSEKCYQQSWLDCHSNECAYFRLIVYKYGISHMEHLALRIILKTNYNYLKSIKDELINFENEFEIGNKSQFKIDMKKSYDSNDYKNIFNLITHSNKRISSDLIRRAMVAGLFLKFLIKTSYFNNENINENSDDFYFIGGLILRHLQSISCNAHEISEFQYNTNSVATSITAGVGAGIYAILSLFNHSCDPHVIRNFNGTSCVLRSIRRIKEGTEIFDNYGKLYAVNDIEDRQFKLQDQYFFDCKCEACESKWPLYDKIPDDLNKIKYQCDVCMKTTEQIQNDPLDCCFSFLDKLKNVKHRIEKDRKYCRKALKELLDAKKPDKIRLNESIEKFCRYLSYIDTYVATKPFLDFNDCQEALKQCYNMLGNKYEYTKLD